MSDMKCPFCQQEYIITKDDSCFGQQRCVCRNPNCEFDGWHFPVKLVSELIRTRKALDVAVDVLKEIDKTRSVASHKIGTKDKTLNSGIAFCWATPDEIHNTIEQITALEQKDVK